MILVFLVDTNSWKVTLMKLKFTPCGKNQHKAFVPLLSPTVVVLHRYVFNPFIFL